MGLEIFEENSMDAKSFSELKQQERRKEDFINFMNIEYPEEEWNENINI